MEFDPINKPKHYTTSEARCFHCGESIEHIDVTRHMSFNLGNVVKYLWRWQRKGGLEDLKKARWYLEDTIKDLEKSEKTIPKAGGCGGDGGRGGPGGAAADGFASVYK